MLAICAKVGLKWDSSPTVHGCQGTLQGNLMDTLGPRPSWAGTKLYSRQNKCTLDRLKKLFPGPVQYIRSILLATYWELVAGFPVDPVGVAGHDHPLQIDGHRVVGRVDLFGNHDLPAQIDAGLHRFDGPLPHRLAVDVKDDIVPENAKVHLVPFFGEGLGSLPGNGLEGPVILQDRQFHGLLGGVQANGKLGLASPAGAGAGDPDQVPPPIAAGTLLGGMKCGDEAVLFRKTLVDGPTVTSSVDPGISCRVVCFNISMF